MDSDGSYARFSDPQVAIDYYKDLKVGFELRNFQTNPSTISNWKKNNKIPKSYMNKLDILLREKNLITYTEHENNKNITPIKKNSKFSTSFDETWGSNL